VTKQLQIGSRGFYGKTAKVSTLANEIRRGSPGWGVQPTLGGLRLYQTVVIAGYILIHDLPLLSDSQSQ